ncbi:MAG: hypothetical protein CMJ06_02550 [Pelagibacterales bacterium]|nr:hypothetical protein [Pelagibacterales bacterium]OUU62932.1 MAG: hypothetical protein CBC22_02530 [Alphaproteobacteria bacterium TMED62]
MIEISKLKKKQFSLIMHLKLAGTELFKFKTNDCLSPIGWHIIHCLYVECIWIRSYFFGDNLLVNKLKNIADSNKIKPKNRGLILPEYNYLYEFSKNEFNKNLILCNKIKSRKKLLYFLQFLINHHSQHLETIKIILNLINLKNKNAPIKSFSKIEEKVFNFNPVYIKEGYYKIGTSSSNKFSYDNEKPEFIKKLKSFLISKNLIRIDEWLCFLNSGGYKKKSLWSKAGWDWKCKNKITHPLGWKINKESLSISTAYGYEKPNKDKPVSNISFYELEAFANWVKLKIPHEFQWEAANSNLLDKYKVWEWHNNKFFPYENFMPYPYDEYSLPWFNNNYYTLRGASIFSETELKRKTFRNFYQPHIRFIFSGGRLSTN